jgi:hypothetical protein
MSREYSTEKKPEDEDKKLSNPNAIYNYDDSYIQLMHEREFNEKENERQAKLEAKRREEDYRQMVEYEKQQEERNKRDMVDRTKLPEQQLQMLLSGKRSICSHCHLRQNAEFFNHSPRCVIQRGTSLEPGLWLLKEEFRVGKIIRLDEQTRNRLVEFAKPDETYVDLLNRLMDIAAATPTAASEPQTLTGKTIDVS